MLSSRRIVVLLAAMGAALLASGCARRAPQPRRGSQGTAGAPPLGSPKEPSPALRILLPFAEVASLAALDGARWAVAAGRSLAAASEQGVHVLCTLPAPATCIGSRIPSAADPTTVTLYAGVGDHVEIFTIRGRQIVGSSSSPGLGADALLVSVAPYRDGYCVSDATNAAVFVFREDGLLVGTIGPGAFLLPSPILDLAPAGDEGVWVAHAGRHRVERWSIGGALEQAWGAYSGSGDGFAGCCNPAHLALLPDGRLVTGEKGLGRVRVYGPSGALEGTIVAEGALPPGGTIADIATDATGRIGVLIAGGAAAILVFDPGGTP